MKKIIVVEDKLKEVFNYLPDLRGENNQLYKPVFKTGDEKELMAFFSQTNKEDRYPLIWLDMPYEEHHSGTKVEVELNLVLAVKTSIELLTEERLELTYKPILYPLAENILKALWISNTVKYDKNYKIIKFPNHSSEDNPLEAVTTDLWDSIKLTVNCEINNNCLRTIKI